MWSECCIWRNGAWSCGEECQLQRYLATGRERWFLIHIFVRNLLLVAEWIQYCYSTLPSVFHRLEAGMEAFLKTMLNASFKENHEVFSDYYLSFMIKLSPNKYLFIFIMKAGAFKCIYYFVPNDVLIPKKKINRNKNFLIHKKTHMKIWQTDGIDL